jgi:predicted lipid-binding transport protein (Tim44 family)
MLDVILFGIAIGTAFGGIIGFVTGLLVGDGTVAVVWSWVRRRLRPRKHGEKRLYERL